MTTAVAAGVACSYCAGGGEVNGVQCRNCKGKGRIGTRPKLRSRLLSSKPALAAAAAAGTVVRWSRSVPGVAGAAAVTLGVAMIVHAACPRVPALAVGLVVGGLFGLAMDRAI